jgi:hypothetical protein
MYYNRKKKKLTSIVDTYTKKAKYSEVDELYDKILSGDELLDRIQEFKNTNEHYLDLELKYINFLREYETHYKKFELVSTSVKEFYEANIVRSTVKETTLKITHSDFKEGDQNKVLKNQSLIGVAFTRDSNAGSSLLKLNTIEGRLISRVQLFEDLLLKVQKRRRKGGKK